MQGRERRFQKRTKGPIIKFTDLKQRIEHLGESASTEAPAEHFKERRLPAINMAENRKETELPESAVCHSVMKPRSCQRVPFAI